MAEQTIQLRQHALGMEPYVLVTIEDGTAEDNLNVGVEYGGGPSSPEDARLMLLLALSQMGPCSEAELAELRGEPS